MRKISMSALLVLAVSGTLSAQATPKSSPPAPKIAAVVNGEVITVEDLDRLYRRLTPEVRENYERSGGKLQFLDVYIGKKLMVQQAVREGADKRPEIAFELKTVRDNTLFDRYIREVVSAKIIPEMDIAAYYEAHKEDFQRAETIRARHIIVTPNDRSGVVNSTKHDAVNEDEALVKIESIQQQLKAGADFLDLASKYSEDSSAKSGGDLGWFGRGKMVPAFEEAAFKLQKGQTSAIVKSDFGYHLIRVEDRKPGGTAPLHEVRGEIRELLITERADRVMAAVTTLTQDLRKAAAVTIHKGNL